MFRALLLVVVTIGLPLPSASAQGWPAAGMVKPVETLDHALLNRPLVAGRGEIRPFLHGTYLTVDVNRYAYQNLMTELGATIGATDGLQLSLSTPVQLYTYSRFTAFGFTDKSTGGFEWSEAIALHGAYDLDQVHQVADLEMAIALDFPLDFSGADLLHRFVGSLDSRVRFGETIVLTGGTGLVQIDLDRSALILALQGGVAFQPSERIALQLETLVVRVSLSSRWEATHWADAIPLMATAVVPFGVVDLHVGYYVPDLEDIFDIFQVNAGVTLHVGEPPKTTGGSVEAMDG